MKTKRIIAFALVLIMAISAIPFGASASESTAIDVSFVNSNGTIISGEHENIFDGDKNTSCVTKNTTEGVRVTGKLATDTVITQVTINMHSSYANRSYTSTIEASLDGYHWTQIAQNNTEHKYNNDSLAFPLTVTDTNVYRYIRFVQNSNFKGYEPGITEIEVMGIAQDSKINVSLVEANGTYNTDTYGKPENVFDGDTDTSYITKNETDGVIIMGMLEDYTVIKKVILTVDSTKANRTKNSYIQASVDGVTWEKIAQNTTDSNNNNGSLEFPLTVTDTTAYRYIRFVQNSGYKAWDLGIAEIEVQGTVKSSLVDTKLISASTNELSSNGTKPENVFDHTDATQYIAKNTTEGVIIDGQFNGKYVITSVAFKTFGNYVNRTRTSCIQGSNDGENWTTLVTHPGDLNYAANGSDPIFSFNVTDTTAYRYVRFKQGSGFYDWEIGLYEIEIKGIPVSLEVTPIEANSNDSSKDMSNVFKDNMTDTHAIAANNAVLYGVAQLEKPTQITRVIVRAPAASMTRMRYMLVKASVDGETWDTLVKCPYVMASNEERTYAIDNDNYYKYIRYEQDSYCASQGWYFGVGSVLVDGNELEEHEGVEARGVQIAKTNANDFSARFICTAGDVSEFNAVGIEINAITEDGTKKKFVENIFNVYTSILGLVDGVQTEIKAGEGVLIGGKYVYTLVVEEIPLDCGITTFEVTPYFYKAGERFDGMKEQFVLDGAKEAEATVYDLQENESNLKVSGRSYELAAGEGIACDFTASGIEFNAFCGGDIKLKAKCTAVTYYTVYVNGVRQAKRLELPAGTATVKVVEDLPMGNYNIKLVKQSHVNHNRSALISIAMNGSFTAAPTDNEYLIEFVGDSITCGYGTVNYPDSGVTSYGTAYYCDATEAYAYKTADMLGTDYSMVSVSGWAVIDGDTSVPAIYGKTSWHRGETAYVPERKADIVVINLGTNDQNLSNYLTDFVSDAVAFIGDVRAMHGEDVTIIWAYGAMMKDDSLTTFEGLLEQIVEQTDILSVKIAYDQSAGNSHPSAAGHTASAEILAEFIQNNNLLN